MRRLIFSAAIAATALAAGCTGDLGYRATVTSGVYAPDLVYVAPGVQVIADYDEPIFYADNFYWRYDGASWYRSSYYGGGWMYASPPVAVLRIQRPQTFVHYRPHGWAPRPGRRPGPGPGPREDRGRGDHGDRGGRGRDHRR